MKRALVPLLTAVAVISVMALQSVQRETVVCEPPSVKLGEISGYASEPVEASDVELKVLPSDTVIDKRLYTASDGSWHLVSLVIGGKSKNSIHRPELCLPSGGFSMSDPMTIEVGGVPWRTITLRNDRGGAGFAYTFFNQTGFGTSSHVSRIFRDVWDRSVLGRIDRWAMLTVTSSRGGPAREGFLARLRRLVPSEKEGK